MNPLLNLFIRIAGIILFILIETQSDLIEAESGSVRIIWFILMIIALVMALFSLIMYIRNYLKVVHEVKVIE